MGRRLVVWVVLAVMPAGCSGASTEVVPAGWKAVNYRGIAIDVPGSWTVEPWHATCGVRKATVFIGPQGMDALGCPSAFEGAQVILGALPPTDNTPAREQTMHGLKTRLWVSRQSVVDPARAHPARGTMVQIEMVIPSRDITIWIAVGNSSVLPGGAPGRAETIALSLRAVSR